MNGGWIKQVNKSRYTHKSHKLKEYSILVSTFLLLPIGSLTLDICYQIERYCCNHINKELSAFDISETNCTMSHLLITIHITIVWHSHEIEHNVQGEEKCA